MDKRGWVINRSLLIKYLISEIICPTNASIADNYNLAISITKNSKYTWFHRISCSKQKLCQRLLPTSTFLEGALFDRLCASSSSPKDLLLWVGTLGGSWVNSLWFLFWSAWTSEKFINMKFGCSNWINNKKCFYQ